MPNLQEMFTKSITDDQAREAAEITDVYQKIITANIKKSIAYTNLMLFGGYAGFFALWQFTKEFLSRQQVLWAALLVFISLVCFIVFEVVKMLVDTNFNQKKAALLRSPLTRSNKTKFLTELNQIELEEERCLLRIMQFWGITTTVVIGTALAGAGILGWAFVASLLKSS